MLQPRHYEQGIPKQLEGADIWCCALVLGPPQNGPVLSGCDRTCCDDDADLTHEESRCLTGRAGVSSDVRCVLSACTAGRMVSIACDVTSGTSVTLKVRSGSDGAFRVRCAAAGARLQAALSMVSPTMKALVDAVWAVWSIGASIYDYIHTNAMEERIHALEDVITIHQCVIGLLSAGVLVLLTYIVFRSSEGLRQVVW
ncbi:hypothetical protein D5F01_LYC00146 [Larimichthys crocea]|uniref:Uncharacterized protein n=1 Tax=Larimichthys crocea TaxID=215358 RepID=A0A6G0J8B7_LARCR|nr:hypothetical protein D5F01_LYC00146 [Larimichthys crocea]